MHPLYKKMLDACTQILIRSLTALLCTTQNMWLPQMYFIKWMQCTEWVGWVGNFFYFSFLQVESVLKYSWLPCWFIYESYLTKIKKIKTYHDETRIVSIPPTEWRDADFWNFPSVQHFTSTMCVPTENQTGTKPPYQLEHKMVKHKN